MDIGLFAQPPTIDKAVEQARATANAGFRSFWMPQIFGLDTLSALGCSNGWGRSSWCRSTPNGRSCAIGSWLVSA